MRFLPLIVAALVAVPLIYIEGKYSDRWNPVNTQALQCALLLEDIPNTINVSGVEWVGQDRLVDEKTRRVAGAKGYISRWYVNQQTGDAIWVWLVVGHYRDIVRHTPNVCYRGQGMKQIDKKIERYDLSKEPTEDGTESGYVTDSDSDFGFYTTKFGKPDPLGTWERVERVYWAWWEPNAVEDGGSTDEADIRWLSPRNPRLAFSYPRAIYKLYFMTETEPEGKADDSNAIEFARTMLPIINEKIAQSGALIQQPLEQEVIDAYEARVKERTDKLQAEYDAAIKAAHGGGHADEDGEEHSEEENQEATEE